MSDYPKTGGSYRINEKGEFVRVTDEHPPAPPAVPEPKPVDEPEAKKK
jgi:hypothetical protein